MKTFIILALLVTSVSALASNLNRDFKRDSNKMTRLALLALNAEDVDCVNDYFVQGVRDTAAPFKVFGGATNYDNKVINKSVAGYISSVLDTSRYEKNGNDYAFKISIGAYESSGEFTVSIESNRSSIEQSSLIREVRKGHGDVSLDRILGVLRIANKKRELCSGKLLDLNQLKDFIVSKL